jgi:hypothetical protein
MYDATNQENTSLTRTVSALPVVIGCGVSGNDGQHMSIGLAAPICATCMGSAATTGCERGVIESGVDASLSKRLGRHRTDPRYVLDAAARNASPSLPI